MNNPVNNQNQPSDVTTTPVVEEVMPPLPEASTPPPPPDSSPFAGTSATPATTPPPTLTSNPSAGSILSPTPPLTSSGDFKPKRKINKKIVAGLAAVLFLTVGTVAGVYTVMNNRQAEKSLAADATCYSTDTTNGCPLGDGVCWRATTNNACLVNGVPEGTREVFSGPGTWDGQVCYTCEVGDDAGSIKCSTGISVELNPDCATGGGDTPTPTPSPTPLAVCGDTCQQDSDCAPSTHPSVGAVVCRAGECVNQECYDSGGTTVYGTLCLCQNTGQCGAECGADIGLCDTGFSCTYRAQSQCNPANRGVCVPNGTNTSTGRGPMIDVPLYDGAAFERRQCGTSTADPNNNYVYHPSFPNHVFTTEEVLSLICNPTPLACNSTCTVSTSGEDDCATDLGAGYYCRTDLGGASTSTGLCRLISSPDSTTCTPEDINAICTDIRAYDSEWNLLTVADLPFLSPGDQVYFTTRGQVVSTVTGNEQVEKARFYINSTTPTETASTKPGNNQEFYVSYTIPAITGAMTFTISAELYHTDIGWF